MEYLNIIIKNFINNNLNSLSLPIDVLSFASNFKDIKINFNETQDNLIKLNKTKSGNYILNYKKSINNLENSDRILLAKALGTIFFNEIKKYKDYYNLISKEYVINKFTAELLVPDEIFNKVSNKNDIIILKSKFAVPTKLLKYKLKDLE